MVSPRAPGPAVPMAKVPNSFRYSPPSKELSCNGSREKKLEAA